MPYLKLGLLHGKLQTPKNVNNLNRHKSVAMPWQLKKKSMKNPLTYNL